MNPSNKDYWRALILYGKQQSTYKIALGNCLLNYSYENCTKVSLDDLTEDFFNIYLRRLETGKSQLGTLGRKTVVEREIDEIKFAGGGLIERIDKDIMVIGDTMRQIAPEVTYHSGITGLAASRSEFRIGVYVGYQLNDKRQIISLLS